FYNNRISDLSPLANWNTGKVTDMDNMFYNNRISDLSPLADWNTGKVTDMSSMFSSNRISDLSPLANWNTGNVTVMENMFANNRISDLSPLANWNTGRVYNMYNMFNNDPLSSTINSQSTLNKFHAIAYKFDNIGTLASGSESKTFNDGSQILLDKNVVTKGDSATLTFKANSSAGNTYQIKIYNPNGSINIQAAPLPTALGTTDKSYQDGYTIITNKFINNGSVSQDISIVQDHDKPAFAQYESTSGLITVVKDNEDLGSINITYQNGSDINNHISTPYIVNKPYINHTQNTFYFQPQIDPNSVVKSAGLTITVPDDVTIDPDTFIDDATGKTLKATKIADNQYQVVLNNTTDRISVKGLINVPADKLTNGTVHLPGFGMKYTINTYNDKVAPLVATGTSEKLSIIPDLASYHGKIININQSKWAFDRNGNKVFNYTSQGFNNTFNGIPLEPAVATQVTNGVETFDMPTGVNITSFVPPFNSDVINHIDYIYTDGSKQTTSSFSKTPKAIRQMKVYFKNGIQSYQLADGYNKFALSFDTTYPDGTPVKNFDTFKITGSFSCDELGLTDNVDVAQVMLAPKQKLTDGMLTDTSQSESNKAPNANGNSISATIRNDGFQHQGHLTNPIFYFKYNDLMVPDLSEISASYDNQNKELGSIGLTNIDNNKIHSSIITDSTGQKFIKVQVDGEYYYGGSSDFNVHIPIINAPDALTATKDWSWYILNNSDEAKTESAIRNSSQSNKLFPATVDGNTLSVGGTGTWQILVAEGFTSSTETQGNLNGGPGFASTQDDHQQDPTHFNIYDSIINATNDAKSDLVSVTNLPSIKDGTSQFDVHMTGKASLINVMTGQTYDATITYSYGTGDNEFITGDQVNDWSKVKSIKVVPNGGAPSMTSLRLVVPVEDEHVYDHVGKTIYVSTMTYGEDKTNTNYTIKDGFAVPEKSTILPNIIKAGDMASAKLTVQGQATVHTLIHYKDANGKDVYVKLADQDKTYKELQDTMKRSDYLQSDSDLTIADRGLLPTGMIINYSDPTIRNSNNTYAADYANNVAGFDKTAKYDFDGDQVIFEGAMPEIVTRTHQAKETIHYVYSDGRKAKPDKVLTSITLKQTGSKNPFTGEITWNASATATLYSVVSPEITGYIADNLTVPSYVVTMDSPDKEVTVTYYADNETADFTYIDDTTNSTLKVVKKSGKSNTPIGYNTTDEINNYKKLGYTLVSDDTGGRSLNFDSLPAVDQHYMIYLKHKTESVTGNGTVTRTIHYLYDDGNTAKPDKTQTVSFNETGTKDYVTGETTWDNDDVQTVDSVITPSITGYTPDKSSVEKQTFKFGDKDVEVTVRYTANTQTATITYIDDTENKTLGSDKQNGKFNQVITFEHDPAEVIKGLEEKGYKLVSNDFNSNKYQADNSNNVFYVHLKHGTSES
ncbi:MAG: BspA family leucine-rich repeat surface protein, partial [Lactobacillus crispatus]